MTSSLILATYNGERLVLDQLVSLRDQTKQFDEVLIFDDASTDNTVKVIKAFIIANRLESTWHILINPNNLGYETNFFDLLKTASSDLIFLCDQDDIWNPVKVEKCISFFAKYPAANLLCTDNDFKNLVHPNSKCREQNHMKFDDSIEKVKQSKHCFHLGRPGCDMIIKRDFLQTIIPFWVKGWAQDDFLWKFSFLKRSTYIYHFCGITRRIHENNTAHKEGKYKYRTISGRSLHLSIQKSSLESLLLFARKEKANQKLQKLIIRNIKSLSIRIKMLESRNFFLWCLMLYYIDTYPRKKGYFLDLLIILKGK